ncbi:AraC family transcriptional regulator [Persicirhabdus sediminis]|uniref:AraC family transcriptional regulator n=1 Tax=Persicirhabdus sediminis TaxID=454144 RepID=A0A8J7MCK1_9BACT|nr:AraC family transcriptional regulator [Persicirhabdus sediminis]MBK1790021.1 AraC family transcriptional regulator [Persicirhabdus sediminis]
MSKNKIKHLIEDLTIDEGLIETGIEGVKLFRITECHRCAPAVYEPTVVAILSGSKEAILDGKHYLYDNSQYMCCSVSMPVEAGTPDASPDNPLLGVYISLDTRVMTQLAIEIESAAGAISAPKSSTLPQGFALAHWDETFTDALLRLLQLVGQPADAAVLGRSRLRELYYAVLKGEAGDSARRAFGVGNEIAQVIKLLSSSSNQTMSVEKMAQHAGMSRAVFHRKFKQATTLSPIQFVKSMRLNKAAMMIAEGISVSEAALNVGYESPSQFSREFKRAHGQSPKQWCLAKASN